MQESGSGSSRPNEEDVKELTVAFTDYDIFVWLTLVRESRSETTKIFIQPHLRRKKRQNILANTRRWSNVGLMLGYRLRSWLSIKPTLNQLFLFTGMHVPCMAVSRFVTITVLYSHYYLWWNKRKSDQCYKRFQNENRNNHSFITCSQLSDSVFNPPAKWSGTYLIPGSILSEIKTIKQSYFTNGLLTIGMV